MVAVSVRQQLAPTMGVVTPQTITTSMEVVRAVLLPVLITAEGLLRTIMTNTEEVLAALQLAPTMVVATLPIIMISTVAAQAVPQPVLTMVEERPPTTMTSTEAVSVRQQLAPIMGVVQPQLIMMLTAIISAQVTTGNQPEMKLHSSRVASALCNFWYLPKIMFFKFSWYSWM